MSFDNKHYPNRKDNRRIYKYDYAKRCDRTCRNHGSCSYCESNRMNKTIKQDLVAKSELATIGEESDLYLEGVGIV